MNTFSSVLVSLHTLQKHNIQLYRNIPNSPMQDTMKRLFKYTTVNNMQVRRGYSDVSDSILGSYCLLEEASIGEESKCHVDSLPEQ